jgi:hypothetical protein
VNFSADAQQSLADENENKDESIENKSDDFELKEKNKISYKLLRGKREIEIVSGFAPTQPTFFSGHKEYNTEGRRFGMLNIRWTRTIGTRKNITYQYFFEATPLAVAFNNETNNPKFISKIESPEQPPKIRKTSYGIGVQPINFRFIFMPNSRIKPFIQIGAGMIFFNHKMPVPESTFYNFTGDVGGGIYYSLDRERQNKAIILGYRYFHISNFNTSKFNPGYNANIFYLGYSFSRH